MEIRKARLSDIERVLEIYAAARAFMRKSGNPTQWAGGYPQREIVEADIAAGQLYIGEQGGVACCVFAFIEGPDPIYFEIEDGAWLSVGSYAAIHRVASDGSAKGVFSQIAQFCKSQCSDLRIDTHEDNLPMQRAIEKVGFRRCGIIHLENGDPRIAYEWLD